MRENKLQKQCLSWARQFDGKILAVNIHCGGYSNKGFPDLLVFGDTKAIAVELKSDSGYKIQPDQVVWRKRFAKAKIKHYLISSLKDFQETVRKEFDL